MIRLIQDMSKIKRKCEKKINLVSFFQQKSACLRHHSFPKNVSGLNQLIVDGTEIPAQKQSGYRSNKRSQSGEIGDIRMFKGCQHIDVFGDPLAPFMWRADGALAPTGIVGDTGSHVFWYVSHLSPCPAGVTREWSHKDPSRSVAP